MYNDHLNLRSPFSPAPIGLPDWRGGRQKSAPDADRLPSARSHLIGEETRRVESHNRSADGDRRWEKPSIFSGWVRLGPRMTILAHHNTRPKPGKNEHSRPVSLREPGTAQTTTGAPDNGPVFGP